jgi:hypothetical protein
MLLIAASLNGVYLKEILNTRIGCNCNSCDDRGYSMTLYLKKVILPDRCGMCSVPF